MKIIGHRGAAGLYIENTKASLLAALKAGVDGIEIDIRKTIDNKVVLFHDDDLTRITSAKHLQKIKNLTLNDLKKITLPDGSKILTLEEALRIIKDTPVVIELKDEGCARTLLSILKKFPKTKITITSFNLHEIVTLRDLAPKLTLYGSEHTRALEMVHFAKMFKLQGITLNFWLLNPLTYLAARRAKLDLLVYTINNPFNIWFIRLLYPEVMICTDFPNKYVKNK